MGQVGGRHGLNFATAAAVLAAVMAVVYVSVMRQQGEHPLVWVLGVLLTGAALAAHGARVAASHRRLALVVAGLFLSALGLLALLSIGLPMVVAGVLCFLAAARSPQPVRP